MKIKRYKVRVTFQLASPTFDGKLGGYVDVDVEAPGKTEKDRLFEARHLAMENADIPHVEGFRLNAMSTVAVQPQGKRKER